MSSWKFSTAAIIVVFCLSHESHLVKGTERTTQEFSEPRIRHGSRATYSGDSLGETQVTAIGKARELTRGDPEEPNKVNETNITEEKLKDLISSFVAFPFFPLRFPELKRDVPTVNATDKIFINANAKMGSDKSVAKAKPFSFIDFAFNIRESPPRNLSGGADIVRATNTNPENVYVKDNGREMDVPFDVLDDDWSFFDDSPMLSPDMDEFLPKPDFLFFDFPFHKKHNKKYARRKRGMTTPVVKSDINFIMDIFDEALSRTKKEMEKPVPFWEFLSEAGRNVRSEDRFADPIDKTTPGDGDKLRGVGKYKGDKRSTKRSHDMSHQKNPVILGKIFEIGEIHFGNDYPKTKKKRRNVSLLGKKGNRDQDASFEVIQMNRPLKFEFFPKHLDFTPLQTSLKEVFHRIHQERQENAQVKDHDSNQEKISQNTDEAKILDLMTQWDRRELEELGKSTTQKSVTAEEQTRKVQETGAARMKLDHANLKEGFKFVGHTPSWKHSGGDGVNFEVIEPENSFPKSKRLESRSDDSEKASPSREEVRRNITDVLGQFFSMITKLGDTKSFYQDKEVEGNGPDMEDSPGFYGKGGMKKLRRARNTLAEEEVSHPVADLNYLFLTVTLPTMFAFTLLLAVCFFNLKIRGWLCTKLFKPRNVYVVEGDVEKANKGAPAKDKTAAQANRVKNVKQQRESLDANQKPVEKHHQRINISS